MAYTDLADYLVTGYPTPRKSQTTAGSTYLYRGPASTLATYEPDIDETWADSRLVSGTSIIPLSGSDFSELTVETQVSLIAGVTISSSLESARYQIRWQPNDLPLFQHPAFLPGGSNDLLTAASGSPSRTHMADVIGWENETDNSLKFGWDGGTSAPVRKYKLRDSNGVAYGSAITLAGNALAYVKLRELGYDSRTTHLPLWQKVSTYRGTDIPGVGTIGQYVAEASVPGGPPTGYQWIKVQDDADRIGKKPEWDRVEAWQGFVKVYFDIDSLNPAGNTLP